MGSNFTAMGDAAIPCHDSSIFFQLKPSQLNEHRHFPETDVADCGTTSDRQAAQGLAVTFRKTTIPEHPPHPDMRIEQWRRIHHFVTSPPSESPPSTSISA